ncbi:MAG: cell filamentation protein Fic [Robiginitomaculum sp.]|nr:MAG: cell filamentation protein Fic [Robiginitomaculum sp.]
MADTDLTPRIGEYVTTTVVGEPVRAYIPRDLPLVPPIDMQSLSNLVSDAMLALGRLDGVRSVAPDTSLFLYMYVRKEALLSSQIEGTQSTLSDLLLYENEQAPGAPVDDVEEVSTYVAALDHGLKRMKGGFPLSMRLMREMHGILLSTGRGSTKLPGEFRQSQNWIGGTRPGNALFVPPPPGSVLDLMTNLESFLHAEDDLPTIVKAGIAHLQFETIHPFLDGNGRLGRLLITLYLCSEGILEEPLLYLSLYLKTHRKTYYQLLNEVRDHGRWEVWLEFFLVGVKEVAEQANAAARRISNIFEVDAQKISSLKRAATMARKVHEVMRQRPIVTIALITKLCETTVPTATNALGNFEKLGIVHEITGKERGRVYAYTKYLEVLDEGTDPIV